MGRKDLFALMTFTSGHWCIERIYSQEMQRRAFDERNAINADLSRQFPLVDAKVVHPSEKQVDIYVLAGNTIVKQRQFV